MPHRINWKTAIYFAFKVRYKKPVEQTSKNKHIKDINILDANITQPAKNKIKTDIKKKKIILDST